MSISGISGASGLPPLATTQAPRVSQPEAPGFGERIGGAMRALADAQTDAQTQARAFETGAATDLSSVMVSQEVSSLGFQLALNVRNKALGAYRDIMNMPV